MGNLSNLYISQSFISLIHLGSNNTASATLTELEDGLGNGVGISVNTNGDLKVDGILSASIITELSQSIVNINGTTASYATTGSNTFIGNQTITGDVQINGILSATEIHTLIESSSIIFSSGSNILGDALDDTQTLNGTVIISGSQSVSGSAQFTGTISSPTITTINGRLGNLENFSASSNSRLNNLESKSASVDISISNLNSFTQSLFYNNDWTASAKLQLSNLESKSASVDISISNINTFTASNGNTSLNQYTASNDTKWNTLQNVTSSLIAATSSYATTGSNTFNGNQTITGSVNGNVISLSITSNTASMNLSQGNLFTLTLTTGSTHLDATNIGTGQTLNLLITQAAAGNGTLTLAPKFKQPAGFIYSATTSGSSQDLLSFVTFGSAASIYTVNAKQMV